MTEEHKQCGATTKAGTRCKNRTMGDSDYCRVHRIIQDEESAGRPTSAVDFLETGIEEELVVDAGLPTSGGSDQSRIQADFEILAAELNALASEIQASIPDYVPPVFTADGLVALVKSNLDRFTPDMQIEIVSELRGNLEGTSPRDLIDPDTWKGLWYILNYTVQAQSTVMIENVYGRLAALPGVALLSDLKGNLAGTSPKEFLDPDTWKGMWLVMNYSIQATAADLKRKIDGEDED